jgi:hypothetical protein
MRQSRLNSFIEGNVNTASAFGISYMAGFIIFPLFHYNVSAAQNLGIVSCFTALSIGRNYLIRRLFNWWHHR